VGSRRGFGCLVLVRFCFFFWLGVYLLILSVGFCFSTNAVFDRSAVYSHSRCTLAAESSANSTIWCATFPRDDRCGAV